MTLKFESHNYPSSIGSKNGDKLVQWCHGAPGWIHMFLQAYKVGVEKHMEMFIIYNSIQQDVFEKYYTATRLSPENLFLAWW